VHRRFSRLPYFSKAQACRLAGRRSGAAGRPIGAASEGPGRPSSRAAPAPPLSARSAAATRRQTTVKAARCKFQKKLFPIVPRRSRELERPTNETLHLQGYSSIGETGFEPATARPPARCALQRNGQPGDGAPIEGGPIPPPRALRKLVGRLRSRSCRSAVLLCGAHRWRPTREGPSRRRCDRRHWPPRSRPM
jgi:hypothetical protein